MLEEDLKVLDKDSTVTTVLVLQKTHLIYLMLLERTVTPITYKKRMLATFGPVSVLCGCCVGLYSQ